MFKSIKRAALVLLVVIGLVGCSSGSGDKGSVTLKLWGAQEDQEFLQERVEAFKAANSGTDYTIELAVMGEGDAREELLKDPTAGADVFPFANDHIRDLVKADILYEITADADAIKSENVEGSVEAATLDGKLYAYPFTADNGYFMYYNKDVISDAQAESLESMLDAAAAAGKKVYFDFGNSWYIASFFMGAGLEIQYADGKNIVDWNNETGVKVGNYLRMLATHPGFIGGDDAVLESGYADGSIVAAVSGTWQADNIKAAWGNGYAATKLPTIDLDGATTQLSSFAGYKLYGVNTATEFPEEALALANFLSNEESQKLRFEARGLGPSNKVVLESKEVQENVALNALTLQEVYAKSQKDVTGNYWGAAEAFGKEILNGSQEDMQTLLDAMVEQIEE